MTEGLPSAETQLTPEQLAIQQLTASAEAVFTTQGIQINELSGSRTVNSGEASLTEHQDPDGNSRFSFWTGLHSDAGISEHVYGDWQKGGSEALADTNPGRSDRAPLDIDGLVRLKERLDTTFPVVTEKPSEPKGLRGFIGGLATKRELRRAESAERYIEKLKAKHANRSDS